MEFDIKLDYQKKLKEFQDLFLSGDKIKFQTELDIIDKALKNLEKRISFAVVGPPKSGKSLFLNALIGKELLESNDLNCSFFALKIQTREGEPFLFDSKNIPILGNIKESIKKQNEIEREIKKQNLLKNGKNEVQVLELRTPIKGLLKTKDCHDIKKCYSFIQFIDLPGINDDTIHYSSEEIINYSKKIQSLQNQDNGENVSKNRFLECIDKITIDFLIFLLSVDQIHRLNTFFTETKQKLFSGSRQAAFDKLRNEKRIIILINKSDKLEKNDGNLEKTKIKKRIFYQFYGKNIDKKEECIININDVEEEKKRIETFENDYKVRFISSMDAFKQIIFDEENEKNKLKGTFQNEEIALMLKKMKIKAENFDSYAKSSEFNEFLLDINKMIPDIFKEKIQNELDSYFHQLEYSKKIFLNRNKDLICKDFMRKNFKTIEKKFEKEFENSKLIIDEIIKKVPIKLKNIENMKKDNIIHIQDSYFEIVSSFFQVFEQTLKNIQGEYQQTIENCLNDLNEAAAIKNYFKNFLDPLLEDTKKNSSREAENLLFDFIPSGINYSRNWIIYFIYSLFTKNEKFKSCWEQFINQLDSKTYAIIVQLKIFQYHYYYADEKAGKQNRKSLKATYKNLWNLCKKLNDIYE